MREPNAPAGRSELQMTEALLQRLMDASEQAELKVQRREARDLSFQFLFSVRVCRVFSLHSSSVY